MKRSKHYWFNCVLLISCLIFVSNPGFADDSCIFTVGADDVPPNILILLDNGAEMEHVTWHSDYDNTVDYTPHAADPENRVEIVGDIASGNGFYNANGYAIYTTGGINYLVPIQNSGSDSLKPGDCCNAAQGDVYLAETAAGGTWEINDSTITLPTTPSTVDVADIQDRAARFRYSKNYLNWIFYGAYAGNGSDLSTKSRFY